MDTFLFVAGGLVALIGTLIAVSSRHIFHAALGLAIALGGTAGLFVPLNGELISVIQILVYLGAVAIAIVFILMLSPPYYMARPRRNPFKMFAAAVIALALVTPLAMKLLTLPAPPDPVSTPPVTVQQIGHAMLAEYLFPFEVIGLLLTVVIIGAIVLARDLPNEEGSGVAPATTEHPEAHS
jgi:NADH-quinone oxidoreductase subunit J